MSDQQTTTQPPAPLPWHDKQAAFAAKRKVTRDAMAVIEAMRKAADREREAAGE